MHGPTARREFGCELTRGYTASQMASTSTSPRRVPVFDALGVWGDTGSRFTAHTGQGRRRRRRRRRSPRMTIACVRRACTSRGGGHPLKERGAQLVMPTGTSRWPGVSETSTQALILILLLLSLNHSCKMPTAATSVAAVALVVAVAFVVIPPEDHGPGRAVQTLEGARPTRAPSPPFGRSRTRPCSSAAGAADYDAPADHASLAARHGDVRASARARRGASARAGGTRRSAARVPGEGRRGRGRLRRRRHPRLARGAAHRARGGLRAALRAARLPRGGRRARARRGSRAAPPRRRSRPPSASASPGPRMAGRAYFVLASVRGRPRPAPRARRGVERAALRREGVAALAAARGATRAAARTMSDVSRPSVGPRNARARAAPACARRSAKATCSSSRPAGSTGAALALADSFGTATARPPACRQQEDRSWGSSGPGASSAPVGGPNHVAHGGVGRARCRIGPRRGFRGARRCRALRAEFESLP